MRRANDNGLLLDKEGKFIGINLGADYCAEHEWGVKKLKELFGIPESGFGIKRRTATKVPAGRHWQWGDVYSYVKLVDTKKHTVLVVDENVNSDYFKLENCHLNYRYKEDALLTSWDEKSFGISGVTKEQRQAIRALYEAIQRKDVAIWLGGGGVFQNAGLVVAIASLVPEEGKKTLHDADVDHDKLTKAAEKTGIYKKLEAANIRYFALSPKWKDTLHKDVSSKYEVIFWLNPLEQRQNNYGYFTVENLEQWIEGEGPIPKKEA